MSILNRIERLEAHAGPEDGLTVRLFAYELVPEGALSSTSLVVKRTGRSMSMEHIPISLEDYLAMEASGNLPNTEEQIAALRMKNHPARDRSSGAPDCPSGSTEEGEVDKWA